MFVIKEEDMKIPAKIWTSADKIEAGAMEQIKNLTKLPFAFHHVAIMPDIHKGYAIPIGGVVAVKDVVLPYGVGNDCGCGVCAQRIHLHKDNVSKEQIKEIMSSVRERIPTGKDHHLEPQDEKIMPSLSEELLMMDFSVVDIEYGHARYQIGSLGSGNHFLEFQYDKNGYLWIMIHSGSRNLGAKVAQHYNNLAMDLNARWHSSIPKEWELAFLPVDTEEGKAYIAEMNYCVEFALANRKLMMERTIESIKEVIHCGEEINKDIPMINIAHNYASLENHFGKNVWVHRKGATKATAGLLGIIPGSQGTKSYIVKGLGNKESFESCSHGAGRLMSRNVARKTINLQEEIKKLDDLGIIHAIRNEKNLDEAPSAYKDINEVINNELDLIEIVEELTPIAVIKGG